MTITINVGLIAKALPCAPLWVAQRSGIFAELGLAVDHQVLGSGDAVTDALRSGTIQIGLTTPEGAISDQRGRGNLRIIAGIDNQLPFKLIGSMGHSTIESLRGGRIGVSSLKEGTVHVIKTMLAKHGLDYPGDYTLDVVGTHVDRWELLQTGEIDAGLQITPYDVIAEQAGFPQLGAPSDYFPEFAFIVASADLSWCEDHRDAVVSFLKGIKQGVDLIVEDSGQSARYVADETGLDTDLVHTALMQLTERGMIPLDLRATPGALASVVDSMDGDSTIPGGGTAQSFPFVHDTFRSQAVG